MTLTVLANAIGISQPYITLILNGKKAVPNDFFIKIRDILCLTSEEQHQVLEAINLHPLMNEEKMKKDRIAVFFKQLLTMANELFAKMMSSYQVDINLVAKLIDFLKNLSNKIFNNQNEVSMI